MAKLLINKIVFVVLITISSYSFSTDFLELNGDNLDSLINVKNNSYFLNSKFVTCKKKITNGYYFFYKSNLFKLYENHIECLNDLNQSINLSEKDTIALPKVNDIVSIQSFVTKNRLILPYLNSTVILNLDNFSFELIDNLNHFYLENNIFKYPTIINENNNYFLLKNNKLYNFKNNNLNKIFEFNIENSFESIVLTLENNLVFLTSTVEQGDLSSFKINLNKLNLTNRLLIKNRYEGIFRNGASNNKSLILINYKKASIFSELFSKNKIYFKIINLKEEIINSQTVSFKVTHKRNHIYYLFNNINQLIALIQCKNGDIFTFNSETKKHKKENFKFNYNYTFIRGKNGGCFFDKKNNNYTIVYFN